VGVVEFAVGELGIEEVYTNIIEVGFGYSRRRSLQRGAERFPS
jgi:hypothetical protein